MDINQVFEAIKNADAAGDKEAAYELAQLARSMLGEEPAAPQQKPKEGLLAAVMKGGEQYLSQARTALQGATPESALAGLERNKTINEEYANQADPEKIIQAYKEKGVLPAALTAAKMSPYAIAEQAPNIASMIAGAQAGQKLGSVFGGAGRLGGAGLGALAGRFASSYIPQAGGNIEAQAQAQQERGEPVNINALNAYGAAAPMAAIDTATMGFISGGRGVIAGLLGKTEADLAKRSAAEVEKLAQEKLIPALLKGTGRGLLAEIPGEVTQDIIQRAQAGQPLTSPEALAGYGRTAIGTALIAPLGAVGRLSERGQARQEMAQTEREKQQAQALADSQAQTVENQSKAQEAAALAAYKDTDEYAIKTGQEFEALQKQYEDSKPKKPGKDGTFEEWAAYKDANVARGALKKKLTEMWPEYSRTKDKYTAYKTAQEQAAEQKRQRELEQRLKKSEFAGAPTQQMDLPGFRRGEPSTPDSGKSLEFNLNGQKQTLPVERLAPEVDNTAEASSLAQQYGEMKQLLETNQAAQSDAVAKGNESLHDQLIAQRAQLQKEHDTVEQKLKDIGHPVVHAKFAEKIKAKLDTARAQYKAMAGEGFDPDKAAKKRAEIKDLEKQYAQYAGAAGVPENATPQAVSGQMDFGFANKEQSSESTASFEAREKARKEAEAAQKAEAERVQKIADERKADEKAAERYYLTKHEISEMERRGLNTSATEQGEMFGAPLRATDVVGTGNTAPNKTRAQLVSDLQIARASGAFAPDKRALNAETAGIIEQLRAFDKSNIEPAGAKFDTAGQATTLGQTQIPARVRQQQLAADARADAYAKMVSILSKYNQGKAKAEELDQAQQTVGNMLVAEIEAVRGKPMTDDERRDTLREVNTNLRELIERFGDTRNLSQKGPGMFVPTQRKTGEFTNEAQFPTVESKAAGRQTFGSSYAAAKAIQGYLDDIRNKGTTTESVSTTRTLTQAHATPQTLRKELDHALAKQGNSSLSDNATSDERDLLVQIADNLKVLGAAEEVKQDANEKDLPTRLDTVTDWVYRVGNALFTNPDQTAKVKEILASIEQAKRSETEIVGGEIKRAVQMDLDTTFGNQALRGYLFDTPEAFDKYLASDALQQMRSTLGMSQQTISRLQQRMAPFIKRADDLQKQAADLQAQYDAIRNERVLDVETLAKMTEEERTEGQRQQAQAAELVRAAEKRYVDFERRLDAELQGIKTEYLEALLAFNYSVQVSKDVTTALQANKTNFNAKETAALEEVVKAKEKLAELIKSRFSTNVYPGGGKNDIGGLSWQQALFIMNRTPDVSEAQAEVVNATRRWRAQYALNQTGSNIVKFLDKDLELQMQLQDEASARVVLSENLHDVYDRLEAAQKKQDRSNKNKKELRDIKSEQQAANDVAAEVEKNATEREELIAELEKETGVTRKAAVTTINGGSPAVTLLKANEAQEALSAQINEVMAKLKPLQKSTTGALTAFIKRRDKARAVKEETQAEREARDATQKKLEQQQVERLAAIPGERISFEDRRAILDKLEAAQTEEVAVDFIVDKADEAIAKLNEDITESQIKLADLDVQIAKTAVKATKKPRSFKGQLEQQSATIELAGLQDQRGVLEKHINTLTATAKGIAEDKADATKVKTTLTDKIDRLGMVFSNDPEIVASVTKKLNNRIDQLKNVTMVKAAKVLQDAEEKQLADKLAGVKRTAQQIANAKKLRKSRNDTMNEYRRELEALEERRSTQLGIKRTPVTELGAPATQPIVESTRLGAPKKGPAVKNTVIAGNVRTGDLSTVADRKLSTQNKITETGQKRPITAIRAQRLASIDLAFEQATTRQEDLQQVREKTANALETAKDANDTAKTTQYTEALKKIDKEIRAMFRKAAKAAILQAKMATTAQNTAAFMMPEEQYANLYNRDQVEERLRLEQEAAKQQQARTTEKAKTEKAAAAAKPVPTPEEIAQDEKDRMETVAKIKKKIQEGTPLNDFEQSFAVNKKSMFRTATRVGTALRSEVITNLVNKMTAGWEQMPNVKVLDFESQLPKRILDEAAADNKTGRIPGLYDANTDTVYLVAENLGTANDVAMTVLHEVAGHFGLQKMLGKDYGKTMRSLYEGNARVKALVDARVIAEPNLSRVEATEEVLADMAETAPYTDTQAMNALRRIYSAIKQWVMNTFGFKNVSDSEVKQLVANARRYVKKGIGGRGGEIDRNSDIVNFKTKPQYDEETDLTRFANQTVAQPKSFMERDRSNLALETEMNTVDMRAGLREALKAGAKGMGDDNMYTQTMNSVLAADQYMPQVQASLSSGPLEIFMDALGLRSIRSTNKNSAKVVFDKIALIPAKNGQGRVALASAYLIAHRAMNKGLSALDLGALGVTEEGMAKALAAVERGDPRMKAALEAVRTANNAYNRGQIEFLASTGAISKKVAADLLKDEDFVPYYRVRSDGTADLVFGGEQTINIGDIRHQPFLAELKGGQTKILPLNESITRNTMLLTKKALYNLATKNVAYAMQSFGENLGEVDAKTGKRKSLMPIHSGQSPSGPNIIRFNQEPDPKDPKDDGQRWLRVQTAGTAMEGIPAELVVRSLEGSSITLPAFLKWGGFAGDLLRKGITRMPPYILRQLYRDPMAATFTAGLNYDPLTAVFKAGKTFIELNRGTNVAGAELIRRGLVQSNIFTGDPSDISAFALQLASGKDQSAIDKLLAMADRAAMNADTATRVLVYENAIKNGLSEVQAEMMTRESMNYYKRGLSPMVQYANRMIPFINTQIQGLNVLYKAARGQMPFNDQQQIQRKFFNNAMLLMAAGTVYALAMDDDEYYKNAKPKDRYTNFFMHIPGVKEPLKIATPYEAGWFFSLAVAGVDAMKADVDTKQQLTALKDMFLQAVPGYSSMAGPLLVPQLVKPLVEVYTNKNFFNNLPVESPSLQTRRLEDRYTLMTTETAKAISQAAPILSPIQIEHIAKGYFGTLPIIAMAAASNLFRPTDKSEKPAARITDLPVIGTSFQRQFGGADADVVYKLALEAKQTRASFNALKTTGTPQELRDFVTEHRAELAVTKMAHHFEEEMGRLKKQEQSITERSNASPDEKRVRLDRIDSVRQRISTTFEKALKDAKQRVGKTTPQYALP